MFRRFAIVVVAMFAPILLAVGGVFGASASATGLPTPQDTHGCTILFSGYGVDQTVEAFCTEAENTYQVIAQCSDGGSFWSVPGSLAVNGSGPSIATCHGALLFPAHVVNYFVVQ